MAKKKVTKKRPSKKKPVKLVHFSMGSMEEIDKADLPKDVKKVLREQLTAATEAFAKMPQPSAVDAHVTACKDGCHASFTINRSDKKPMRAIDVVGALSALSERISTEHLPERLWVEIASTEHQQASEIKH